MLANMAFHSDESSPYHDVSQINTTLFFAGGCFVQVQLASSTAEAAVCAQQVLKTLCLQGNGAYARVLTPLALHMAPGVQVASSWTSQSIAAA
jgi:hypothetical protein